MEGVKSSALTGWSLVGRLAPWGWTGLALALGALAYRPLFDVGSGLPSVAALDRWLFRPAALPAPAVLASAAWLVWRRRARVLALPAGRAPGTAAALAALGVGAFVWALLTGAVDLLFPSLAAQLLGLAAMIRGHAGCRALALPALVLLLGIQIPTPLLEEIVWWLQLWSSAGSAWIVGQLGYEVVQSGVIIRNGEYTFHVIDGCSGHQGTQILLLVSILIRELFAQSGARQWLLVLLAVPLAFVLNLVRIAYIVIAPNPEALAGPEGQHASLGVFVVAVGTGTLYALGWWMSRRAPVERGADGASPSEPLVPWKLATGWLGALALLSLLVTPFFGGGRSLDEDPIRFPEAASGWTSERLIVHPRFMGVLPASQQIHRRFEREARGLEVVELFVGRETPVLPESSQLLASKLAQPGPDWKLVSSEERRLWLLDRSAELSVSTRQSDEARAIAYTWRLRDRGLWRESWRAFLALESSPFRRERARTVVRILTFAPHDGSIALDRAKQRLDGFIGAFREELAAL